jgi:hypothetical protein
MVCASSRTASGATPRRKPLGDFRAIDGMHPREMLRHRPRLVALDRPYEVPDEIADGTLHFSDFLHAFLHIVLAEIALSGFRHGAHQMRGKGLGNRHQAHRFRSPPRPGAGRGDSFTHRL